MSKLNGTTNYPERVTYKYPSVKLRVQTPNQATADSYTRLKNYYDNRLLYNIIILNNAKNESYNQLPRWGNI